MAIIKVDYGTIGGGYKTPITITKTNIPDGTQTITFSEISGKNIKAIMAKYTYDMTSGSFYLSDISGNSIIIHAAWGLSYSATFYVITE